MAAEARVGRATVYRHWPRLTDLVLDALADSAPVVDFGEGDLRSRLLHEFTLRLPAINSPVTVAMVGVLVGRGDHDEQVREVRLHVFGRLIEAITAVIASAAAVGEILSDAPAHELAVMILGAMLLERTMLGVQLTPGHVERIVDTALRGWWSPGRRRPPR